MSDDTQRIARQIATANTKTARRLADESRRRWSGVQADDGPFGLVWTDKAGHVTYGQPGGVTPFGASGRRTGSYTITQGPTVTLGYNNVLFDPDSAVTNEDTAWTYTVPTGGDGFYDGGFVLNLRCRDATTDWAWVNDSLEYWLFMGSWNVAMRYEPNTSMSSGAEFQIGYDMKLVPLAAGDTVSTALRFTSGQTAITVLRGWIGVHKVADFWGGFTYP